jgi:hypothetical protein
MDLSTAARAAIMSGRVLVGGGTLVAPRRMGAVFGVDPADNPAVAYVGRLFGVRALLQVVLLASAGEHERQRQLRLGMAVDVVDALAAVSAGRNRSLSRRAATMAAAAALVEVALGGVALAADRVSAGRG